MSTSKVTHTPTPWWVDPASILGANDETVVTHVPVMADAFHIVKCVNSHDALLAACKAAKLAFTFWHGSGCRCDVCKQLNEAIKLAEGQG